MSDLDAIKKQEGQRIAEIREALGMTVAEFSGRLGIASSTLSNIEKGRFRMGARRMQRVEQLLQEAKYPTSAPHTMRDIEEPAAAFPPRSSLATTVTTDVARQVLDAADLPAVRRAATALAEVLGCTEREAMAKVISAKLAE